MSSTLVLSILVVVLSGLVVAYVWPRGEVRLEKLLPLVSAWHVGCS